MGNVQEPQFYHDISRKEKPMKNKRMINNICGIWNI
jgi:hypothetical protein